MSLPDFSVRRPVTVLMATVALSIFGLLASGLLPIELLPDLSYPTLTIQTRYPDAAPVSVEQFVTRPIEETVGVVAGVREMRSVSRAGLSEVVLEFEWDEAMDFAAMNVREKIGLAEIPREAEQPRVLRFDPSLDPIVRLAFTGDRSLDDLRSIAERLLKPRFEAVRGVAAAKVRGGLDPEIEIDVDEDRLAALGLTLDDLAVALRAGNVNSPGGTLKDWGSVYLVRTLHEFDDLDQIRQTVIRESASGRVRVEDVAQVLRGNRDREEVTRSQGRETVEIALHREGSANTIVVSRAIREELDELRTELGGDLSLTLLTDQSKYIAGAVSEVWIAAWFGGALAILVLYFFLRDPGATAIIAVTIPISVVVTFLPMYRAGVTLNIMSLGGLALGIGMLVDNSIVVLEAIDRHRREGLARAQASARGGAEVAGAVTAATLTTICVFLPIVFVQGVAGQLFYDLAITVCLSLAASLIVSLTLIPMLSSIEYSASRRISLEQLFEREAPWLVPWSRRGSAATADSALRHAFWLPVHALWWSSWNLIRLVWFLVLRPILFATLWSIRALLQLGYYVLGATWWLLAGSFRFVTWPLTTLHAAASAAYPGVLATALRSRWALLPATFALFVLATLAVPLLGTQLVPDLSQGEFAFRLRLPEGTSLRSTAEVLAHVESRLVDDARFERVFSVAGSLPSTASGRPTLGENLAQINFVLPDETRAEVEAQAVERVRQVLAAFPGVEGELVHPSVLSVRPPVVVHLFSDELETLFSAAELVARRLAAVDGLEDVSSSAEPGQPEITVEIDRERATALGVQADALGQSMRRQIRGEVVGQFREQAERLDIRLRASESARDRAAEIEALRFRLPAGAIIAVSAVAEIKIDRGPAAIHRVGGARVAEVTSKVATADLGRMLERVRGIVAGLALPADVVAEMAGQDRELKVSFDSLKLALALAIFMVYVVMAMQFESLRYPFVILLTVPMGMIGVIAAMLLSGTQISVLALIGTVMLAGIVVNNAIVLVDAINRRRAEGSPLHDAILGAGRERLRPILMTTSTTVLALLPMALGLGAGDELRRPMAITVIGGLSVSTILTLFVIPCLYYVFTPTGRRRVGALDPLLHDGSAGAGELVS